MPTREAHTSPGVQALLGFHHLGIVDHPRGSSLSPAHLKVELILCDPKFPPQIILLDYLVWVASSYPKSYCYIHIKNDVPRAQRLPPKGQGQRPELSMDKVKFFTVHTHTHTHTHRAIPKSFTLETHS